MKTTFNYLKYNDWFKADLLTLNVDKTYFIQFLTKNSYQVNMHIDYGNNQFAKSTNTKFFGLIINSILSWKGHVEWVMPKLGLAYYAVRAVKPHISQETVRVIYFSYFYSVMSYGIIFWGNSPHSVHTFRLQKRVIRISTNSRSREIVYETENFAPPVTVHIFSFCYLWSRAENNLNLILRFIALLQDTLPLSSMYFNSISRRNILFCNRGF